MIEIPRLLGLRGEQDKTARSSKLVENLTTGTARKWNYLKLLHSTSKYSEVCRSTSNCLNVPGSTSKCLKVPRNNSKYLEVPQSS